MNDKVLRDLLEEQQLERLRDAKMYAQRLLDISKSTITKIDSDGLKGYYSVHHDCLDVALRLHRASNELYRLRVLLEKLDKAIELGKKEEKKPAKTVVPSQPAPKSKSRKKKDQSSEDSG